MSRWSPNLLPQPHTPALVPNPLIGCHPHGSRSCRCRRRCRRQNLTWSPGILLAALHRRSTSRPKDERWILASSNPRQTTQRTRKMAKKRSGGVRVLGAMQTSVARDFLEIYNPQFTINFNRSGMRAIGSCCLGEKPRIRAAWNQSRWWASTALLV